MGAGYSVWCRFGISSAGWLVLSVAVDLAFENMALRRQLLALHTQRPRRRLTALHKLFWVALRVCWSRVETASRLGHS
jgi:hypothetical protein